MQQLLTIWQFSERLGIKPSTTRSWIWKRKIEFIRVGRCVRVSSLEADRLIQEGRVLPTQQAVSNEKKAADGQSAADREVRRANATTHI